MSEELNLIEISDEDQNKKLSTIVKMDNDLLVKGFPNFSKKWTPFDIDWWNIIDSQVLDQKDNLIKIPISKVKELMYFRKHITNDEFIKKSNDTLKKFMTIQASLEQEDGDKKIYMNVNIFSQSYIDTDYNAWIRVSPQATKYFNNLSAPPITWVFNLVQKRLSSQSSFLIFLDPDNLDLLANVITPINSSL